VNIVLIRGIYTPVSTIGDILVDHLVFCHTLEDVVRKPNAPKVPGKTAIPQGRYPISVTYSSRFKKPLPSITGVEGFTGIRMHGGNNAGDTEGCVIVAHKIVDDRTVRDSAEAAVIELLGGHGGPHFIEIVDTYPYWGTA
jgi:hypothetical protein